MKIIRSGTLLLLAVVAWFALANRGSTTGAANATRGPESTGNFVLVAHGGAGDYSRTPPERIELRRNAMVKAIQTGYEILARDGTSLDAVEATIRELEDSGL